MEHTMTVKIALPEGVAIDAHEYTLAHGVPVGTEYGLWGFTAYGMQLNFTGTLLEAVELLPEDFEGTTTWKLLP